MNIQHKKKYKIPKGIIISYINANAQTDYQLMYQIIHSVHYDENLGVANVAIRVEENEFVYGLSKSEIASIASAYFEASIFAMQILNVVQGVEPHEVELVIQQM